MFSKVIYAPYLAPLSVQRNAGCIIGQDYPLPIPDEKVEKEGWVRRMKAAYTFGLMVITLLFSVDPRARCFILNSVRIIGLAAAKIISGKGAGTKKGMVIPEKAGDVQPEDRPTVRMIPAQQENTGGYRGGYTVSCSCPFQVNDVSYFLGPGLDGLVVLEWPCSPFAELGS